ncbi:hypothetical protein TI04_10670 [Achromatium sp. WMS2]|nr:hypothetical protein TI04_10670 [Achromatium sp. WMS2]
MRWLNQQYLMQADPGRLAKLLVQHLENLGIVETDSPDPIEVIKAQQGRAQTVVELATNSVLIVIGFK